MTTESEPANVLEDALREIVVKDGPNGLRGKRFTGRFLARTRDCTKVGIESHEVYRSRTGKFVVQRHMAEWAEFPNRKIVVADLGSSWKNWRNLFGLGPEEPDWGDYSVEIVDSIDELREHIPAKLHRRVVAAVETPYTEDLNI
ncbi:EXLDI protein [Nocardia sp. NPDC004068]|uniref:EXLDI protein n=1 Tax=Nocardia sp. NPDC004068 TaxID=3364303 RepID=UPI00367AF1B4